VTTFRFEGGIPYVGDRDYKWAFEVNENPPEKSAGYDGFTLRLENGWEVHVMWATRSTPGDPTNPFEPVGDVAAVWAEADGICHELIWHNPESGEWPHEPINDWFITRTYTGDASVIDGLVERAGSKPAPPWLVTC